MEVKTNQFAHKVPTDTHNIKSSLEENVRPLQHLILCLCVW